MARDSLSGYLLVLEDSNDSLPPTTPLGKITVPKNSLVIPKYLNELAKDEQINFSATLTEALKDKLDI